MKFVSLATAALALCPLATASAMDHVWSDASKEAVGTAMGFKTSKVWFTVSHGILTEVYYPRIDQAQVGDSQLLFLTGGRFLEEKRDLLHTIAHPTAPPIPRPLIQSRAPDDSIRFTKEIITDPARDVLRVRYHFEALPDDVQLFLLHKPTVDNDGASDHGRVVKNRTGQSGFVVWDDASGAKTYQAVLTSLPMTHTSVGVVGETDGWQDLRRNGRMTAEIGENAGNLAFTAQLVPGRDLEIAVGFGETPVAALSLAGASLGTDFSTLRYAYDDGWQTYANYLAQAPWLAALPAPIRDNLIWDALVVKSHEDKLNPGAIIASLSIPNLPAGVGSPDGRNTGGYHLVWPRDLFKSGLALLRLGDTGTALNVLIFMSRMEHNGLMAQNAWVDGHPFWPGHQMDEEAFPVLLAYELTQAGVVLDPMLQAFVNRRIEVLRRSSGFSEQERWEEAPGYSPNTLAVMAAALSRAGDALNARRLLTVMLARAVSSRGPLSSAPYAVRISREGNSDSGAMIQIANGGSELPEFRVLDGGFIEWLRWFPRPEQYFGPAGVTLTAVLANTLRLYDNPANGVASYANGVPFYRRYTADAYGVGHVGGPWPILTLERALPEMLPGVLNGRAEGLRFLTYGLQMLGPGELCAEQLDENLRPMPFAASPLVWCHAEFIELAYRMGLNL